MTRLQRRLANEEGTALIIALMAMLLLTALAAVVMVSSTEIKIAGNYNNAQETLYAADAAVERVVQDLLLVPRWNDILTGSVQSALIDGSDNDREVGARRQHDSALLQHGELRDRPAPGRRPTPRTSGGRTTRKWKLFAYAPLKDMLPDVEIDSPSYIAVWVADDPADGPTLFNPTAIRWRLQRHAHAARRGVRPDRHPQGDRGDGRPDVRDRNRARADCPARSGRAEPALAEGCRADPGKTLSNMRMNTSTGNLVVQ